MAARKRTLEQLRRLAALEVLPDTAVVPTTDAALLDGVGVSTWERKRRKGETPPAIKINDRALGYTVGSIRAQRTQRTESKAA